MLGIPVGTAKSRLHRSLGTLRSSMVIDEVTSPAGLTPAIGGPVG
jgi:DNA-directed RNA polymerase specialized sigma24 family protein